MQAIAEHTPDRTELTNTIIFRNFPAIRPLEKGFSNLASHDLPEMLFPEVYAYHTFLSILPMWELEFIYREMEKPEEERFYNQENCSADFGLWSKASYWKVDEAIALALGKDPRCISFLKIVHYRANSQFVQDYMLYHDLAERAKQFGEIFEHVFPTVFMGWAKARNLPFSPLLEELLLINGHSFIDWKEGFENALAECDRAMKAVVYFHDEANKHSATVDQQSATIEEQAKVIQELRSVLIGHLEQWPTEKKLDTRERESLLKIILAISLDFYGFNPKALRSKTTTDIEDAILKTGLKLDADTIRKHLKAATELFSEELSALTE